MGGFTKEVINKKFDSGFIDAKILPHLIKCSKQLKVDCIATGKLLKNNEDSITNKSIAEYLNAEPCDFRYEPQASENYDSETGKYIGRTDIKVISRFDYFNDIKAYCLVECKRIDGDSLLNKKYITEGVSRFLTPAPTPKYSSYYGRSIMFGYVVQAIDIPANVSEISALQSCIIKEITVGNFVLTQEDSQYYVYTCAYDSMHTGRIKLSHLFFDFADVVCKRKDV